MCVANVLYQLVMCEYTCVLHEYICGICKCVMQMCCKCVRCMRTNVSCKCVLQMCSTNLQCMRINV